MSTLQPFRTTCTWRQAWAPYVLQQMYLDIIKHGVCGMAARAAAPCICVKFCSVADAWAIVCSAVWHTVYPLGWNCKSLLLTKRYAVAEPQRLQLSGVCRVPSSMWSICPAT